MPEKEVIFGQVVAKANSYLAVPDKATGGRRIIKNPAIREYERNFASQCKVYKDRLVDGRFKLEITVFQSSMRFDLDNSLKTVLDCLQQVHAITNDSLCVAIDARKAIDRTNPRIEFTIIEYEPKLIY